MSDIQVVLDALAANDEVTVAVTSSFTRNHGDYNNEKVESTIYAKVSKSAPYADIAAKLRELAELTRLTNFEQLGLSVVINEAGIVRPDLVAGSSAAVKSSFDSGKPASSTWVKPEGDGPTLKSSRANRDAMGNLRLTDEMVEFFKGEEVVWYNPAEGDKPAHINGPKTKKKWNL